MSSGEDMAAQLSTMIAGLDRYIDKRAAELAAPQIEAARAEAGARVAEVQAELQRRDDLIAELRRVLEYRDRQLADHRKGCCNPPGNHAAHDLDALIAALPPDQRAAPDLTRYDELLPSRRKDTRQCHG